MLTDSTYQTIFRESADAYLIIKDGSIIAANRAVLKMLGYESISQILNKHPASLSPTYQIDGSSSIEKGKQMLALTDKNGSHQFDWLHLRADGSTFEVDVLLTKMIHDDEPFIHCVWRDLTERRQHEKIVQRTQRMNAIGQMAGGIAHDFNNVLGVIGGNISLLKMQSKLDTEVFNRLSNIETAVEHSTSLVKKLLNLSRKESPEVNLVDVNQVVVELTDLIRQTLASGITLKHSLTQELAPVLISYSDLQDILMNLIMNGVDAVGTEGTIELTTESYTCERYNFMDDIQPGDYVKITICDNGCGIAKHLQEEIYEPFFTTKLRGKGTGLGLSMVYKYLKKYAGTITLESEVGSGTTFTIYLPHIDQHQSQDAVWVKID